jgi:hypothetical protein
MPVDSEVSMIEVEYWNPVKDSIVTGQVAGEEELVRLFAAVSELRGPRGLPAIQLIRPDGSSLSIATDGPRCCLVWTDSLSASFHSVGGDQGPSMVYDYFGSWSEAFAEWTVTTAVALESARHFVQHGAPDTESVLFEPD